MEKNQTPPVHVCERHGAVEPDKQGRCPFCGRPIVDSVS